MFFKDTVRFMLRVAFPRELSVRAAGKLAMVNSRMFFTSRRP